MSFDLMNSEAESLLHVWAAARVFNTTHHSVVGATICQSPSLKCQLTRIRTQARTHTSGSENEQQLSCH